MKKGLLFIAAFLLLQGTIFAQITLTQNDVGAIGSVYYMGVDEVIDPGTTVGNAGANQSWNFAGLNVDSRDTIRFVDPASTPYAASFPAANLCIQQSSLGDGLAYLTSSTSSLEIIGLAGDPADLGQTFVIPQSPSLTVANFPFTYGDNFLDTTEIDITIDGSGLPIPFVDSVRYQSLSFRDLDADAWGNLTLWSGSYNTLRVKEISTTFDSIWVKAFGIWTLSQDSSYTDSSFTWWANNAGYLLCQADFLGPDLNEIQYQNPNPVAVAPTVAPMNRIYPNPANDKVIVEQNGQDYQYLEIMDLQGRTFRSHLLDGVRDEVNISDLPTGLYLYRLSGTEQAATPTGKLQIVR